MICAALLGCALTALWLMPQTQWTSYMPSAELPLGVTSSSPEDDPQPVQMAFLPHDDPTSALYPLDSFERPSLTSRGLTSSLYDPTLFRDVLATHEIELKSNPDELANVEIAATAIDGRTVAPYDTFSFNDAVGERSEDRGFRPGLMFCSGQVITGIGGGVCIVSTALYNTVVNAGYQIIERSPHSGAVRYAAPGLDAAVVYGYMDLRFKNNTPYPLLIRSKAADGKLSINLYGRKQTGLAVELVRKDFKELPFKVFQKQDPTVPEGTVRVKTPAKPGFEVTLLRLFKLNGKEIRREVLCQDRIPPRNKVVLTPMKLIGSMPVVRVDLQPLDPTTASSNPLAPAWKVPGSGPAPQLDPTLDPDKLTPSDK